MKQLICRAAQFLTVLTVLATATFAAPPYSACNSYVGYACVTPFLDSNNSGATTGEPNYPVQVTPGGGSQSTFYTNGSGESQGYIVLIGPTGSSWLIAPNPSPISWNPSFQNVTQWTGYDPNSPGTTVLRPVFACVTGCH